MCAALTRPSTQEFGIAAPDIKKLKENGIHSVEALAHSNKRDLVLMKGLSEAKVDKMQKECKRCKRDLDFSHTCLQILAADNCLLGSFQAGAHGIHHCKLCHGVKERQHSDWNRLQRPQQHP